jgi:AcrR family transcriptional regulator
VAEGTLYRHFADKRALLFAVVLDSHRDVVEWMAALPGRVGRGAVLDTLTDCLLQLARLRQDVLPLELALSADPEVRPPPGATARELLTAAGGPPAALAAYLAAEQDDGRIRPGVDPRDAAVVLLALLFGLAAGPVPVHEATVRSAVTLLLDGIGGQDRSG